MHNTPARRTDPQTSVAVAEHFQATEPAPRSGEPIYCLRFPISQPHDAVRCRNQEGAILAVRYAVPSSVQQSRHRIELRRSGSPSPHPRLQFDPEVSLAVLMQPEDAAANTDHLRMAPDIAVANFAEFSIRGAAGASPYRALTVFNHGKDMQSSQLCVLCELAVLPAYEPTPCADPKSPVARRDQCRDGGGGELLIWRWLPEDVSDAIEAIQAERCPQPEVPVGSLGD